MFLLSASVIDKIASLGRRFLWSGGLDGRKYLVAWQDVTKPFEEGGIGIREVLRGMSLYLQSLLVTSLRRSLVCGLVG